MAEKFKPLMETKLPSLKLEKKEEQNEQVESASTPIEFISYFLGCSTMLHIMHLQNSNPGVHAPLGKLYVEVQDIIDSITEKWQGEIGQLLTRYKNYDLTEYEGMNPIEYVEDLDEYVEQNRYKCFPKECTPIHNEIDDLANALHQCLFLLKFNKPL